MPKPNHELPEIDSSAEGFDQIFLRLCADAPEASKSYVESQQALDRSQNPHNEPYHNKAPLRSETEIRADYAIDFALTILKRLRKRRELDWTTI